MSRPKEWTEWLDHIKFFNQALQLSSVSYKQAEDGRPFAQFSINNVCFSGLLDSGASISCLGDNAHLPFINNGFTLEKYSTLVTTADNATQTVIGSISLPIKCGSKVSPINFLVIPSITQKFILGIDFWKAFNVAPQVFTTPNDILPAPQISEIRTIIPYENLKPAQTIQLEKVVSKFESIAFEYVGLGLTNLIEHRIKTNGPPIKQRYYNLAPQKLKLLEKELDEMLKLGVVVPSRSAWTNPTLLVSKKDGSARFCLDSRRLNACTEADAYPLPLVHAILDRLRNAKFISSIDLSRAFWQIPLERSSCDKTAFVVPGRGMFHFTRLPFGLKNSPAELQRLMDKLFGPESDNNLFCYLDDLIIVSDTFEKHIAMLEKVFQQLRYAGLTINLKKSEFCKSRLRYLGFIVDEKGLRTDPNKVEAMTNFPKPKNAKEVKGFLGLTGYYRRFIKDFSTIAAPLNKITGTRKGVSNFAWSTEAENAFNTLKSALQSAPVLNCPDFSLPFTLHTDASNTGIGGVLTQEFTDGEHPVAYYSRSLNKHEKNYGITEKELLAVLDSIYHFRGYIDGSKFTVVTDHSSLKWLISLDNPSGRLARWSSRLSQFTFDVVHRKGVDNVVPDALSRMELAVLNSEAIASTPPTKDSWYTKIYNGCKNSPQQFPNFIIKEGQLYRNCKPPLSIFEDNAWKLVVPLEEREQIIFNNHSAPESIHPGTFKTYKKIVLNYYWPGLFKQVRNYISKCDICKAYKHSTAPPAGLMGKPKRADRPLQSLSMDLIGPFPRSYAGNMYILSIVDIFTKFCWIFPLKRATAAAIISLVEKHIFIPYGIPRTVIVDNGKQFIANEFKDFLSKYGIKDIFYNTLYTPQNNTVERYNQTINTALAILVDKDQRTWCKNLEKIQAAMNNTVNLTTGYTPYFLKHGMEQVVHGSLHRNCDFPSSTPSTEDPIEDYAHRLEELSAIYSEVTDALLLAHQKSADRYNLRKKHVTFKEKDIVWRRNNTLSQGALYFSAKLAPRFIKAKVLRKISDLVYTLSDISGKHIGNYHIKDIVKSGSMEIIEAISATSPFVTHDINILACRPQLCATVLS